MNLIIPFLSNNQDTAWQFQRLISLYINSSMPVLRTVQDVIAYGGELPTVY